MLFVVALRVFDIVFKGTYGNWQTEVLANYLYRTLFVDLDSGVGSASVIILLLITLPIMIYNVYRNR